MFAGFNAFYSRLFSASSNVGDVAPTNRVIDAHVENVRGKLAERAALGLKKYGVTTERTDLTTLDWLNHAQQEAMDLCVYLERLIQDEQRRHSETAP